MGFGFDDIDRKHRISKTAPSGCAHCGLIDRGLEKRNIAPESATENLVLLCDPCFAYHQRHHTKQWFFEDSNGDFFWAESREEAIKLGREQCIAAGEDYYSICYSLPEPFDDLPIDTDQILDKWDEDNDEPMDSEPLEFESEQATELEQLLNATFKAWRIKHRLGHSMRPMTTDNVETITLPSADEC